MLTLSLFSALLFLSLETCLSWTTPVTSRQTRSLAVKISLRIGNDNNDVPERFPLSIRNTLIQKAKELDTDLSRGERTGIYSSSGWSNRLGTVLTPAAIGVYTADRPFYWNRIDVGCRMTVIQLPSNGDEHDLWIHSPVYLDKSLRDALRQLGTVKYIISPNYEHLKYAPQWAEEFPEAYMWGCPGLTARMPDIDWSGEMPNGIRPSSWNTNTETTTNTVGKNCWDLEEIQPLHINTEVNPFTGKPFFNEVIYYHQSSGTLLTTDLYWNYPQSDGIPNSHLESTELTSWELAPSVDTIPLGSRAWKFGMDRIYSPFYNNFMVRNESENTQIGRFIIDQGSWDIKTVIPAHGDLIRGKELIQTVLRKHLL